ncbi:ligand-binding sensor domain-containing protein [Pedobacter cryoconitis]|uniref:Signal transduction histidine kinase n=1 Tax=Pedobacter cryoconitis TaxID=188932 RepID=A0A327RU07_9SPHI|nr:ATP-binding protein [Pedobacter cryoconitis]RAJ19975.1 signal transduction histidine kinase [Pedobacter cryoconitis]
MIRPLLIFFLLFFSSLVNAQNTSLYSIKHYTDENGLPQNSIKSIAIGKGGFLWLATEDGLSRFDGNHFVNYNKSNTGAASNRMRNIIKKISTGDLYGITQAGELIPIHNGRVLSKPLSFNKILKTPYASRKIFQQFNYEWPVFFIKAEDFYMQTDDQLYYGITMDSITYYDHNHSCTPIPFSHQKGSSFFITQKSLIHMDLEGNFTSFNKSELKHPQLTGDILQQGPAVKKPLKIYWNSNTDQAFIYLNKSLYEVTYKDGELVTKCILSNYSFESKDVMTIYYDALNSRVFLGSLTQGLVVVRINSFNSGEFSGAVNRAITYAQYPYLQDMSLFANSELMRTDGKQFFFPALEKYSNNFSLVIDQHENIWTQKDSSVYRLSAGGKKLSGSYAFSSAVLSLYLDNEHVLWIATEQGIYFKDLKGADFPPVFLIKVKGARFLYKQNKLLWIGTFRGLYGYDQEAKKTFFINKLSGKNIRSIYGSINGELWISTYGDGFYLYNKGNLIKMPADDQNFLKNTHCIIEDKHGFLWMSTNKGLFQVKIKDLLAYSTDKAKKVFFLYYDKSSGFNTNEFNGGCQPCGSLLQNGFIVFPSIAGSVMFNPAEINPELPDRAIYIDKILADNSEKNLTDTLHLTQDVDLIEIFISSPYFGHQNNLNFEYKFAENNKWNKVNNNNIITFTKLVKGVHEIVIRKQNGFNTDAFVYKRLLIIVRPYYYQTWWFYLLVTITLLAGIILITRYRTRNILRQNLELERTINLRTGALKKIVREMQLSQKLLAEQTNFQKRLLTSITHDLMSPLRYMMFISKKLYQTVEDKSPDAESIRALYLSTNSMYHFTENLLNYNKLFQSSSKRVKDHINLHKLVSDKIEVFLEIAKYYHIEIDINIPSTIFIQADTTILSVILHNLIDNAVKFSHDAKISFHAVQQGNTITFVIQDTGVGMSEEVMNWFNAQDTKILEKGLGLKMVIEFAAKIELTIKVTSVMGAGTNFSMSFYAKNQI